MVLVIMAAGMGSRFGGLKQIEPIGDNGEFIIDYSIYDAIKAGFKKIIFIIKEENYDIFRNTVGKRIENKIDVEYVFQKLDNLPSGYSVPEGRVKPWGTAHAILCCKDVIDQNFAIINADDFYGRNAFIKLGEFLKNNSNPNRYGMVGYKVKNTLTKNGSVKRGVCGVNGNKLTNLTESEIDIVDGRIVAKPLDGRTAFHLDENAYVSMNMLGFTPSLFPYLERRFKTFLDKNKDNLEKCEYLIPDVVFEQITSGTVEVEVISTDAVWHGVTYKEDKEELVSSIKDLVNKGEYPYNLWG